MKTIEEKSIEYAEMNDDEHYNNSKNFDKFDIAKAFREGIECAEYWMSGEDELPEIGDEIILKLHEHPFKKYEVWRIADDYDIKLVPVYATHWRPIELK